ncbi:hypothetical protein KI387_017240, partial [Taxus chinensis]
MKIKVGTRFFKMRKLSRLSCQFPELIRRLFGCLRSKISLTRSQGRIPPSLSCDSTPKLAPKGCVTVFVGQERWRYVIPIPYLYHPFIAKLLVEAENEFGSDHKGLFAVPCDADDFEQLKWLIDREK